jgi:hypothetical protein
MVKPVARRDLQNLHEKYETSRYFTIQLDSFFDSIWTCSCRSFSMFQPTLTWQDVSQDHLGSLGSLPIPLHPFGYPFGYPFSAWSEFNLSSARSVLRFKTGAAC